MYSRSGQNGHRFELIAVSNFLEYLGSGCSTAVEHTSHDSEVVGSNPAGCWAFSLLHLICSVSLIRSLKEMQH